MTPAPMLQSSHTTHPHAASQVSKNNTVQSARRDHPRMAEAKAKAEALLLAFLVLTSCFVASSSSCIPRRLLLVSTVYNYRAPCNDDARMDRPPKLRGSNDDGVAEATGSRIPKGPRPPIAYSRAMAAPPGTGTR